tara:strand:+ start:38 stop:976 length:939 start_codon:yes stop_codon:yes gene_type:complete
MEAFDKVEELLLAEGYSKEEIPAIMVSLVEQGFDPTQVFLGGIANMLNLLPKKKTTPKVQPKVTTTSPTGGPLGTRTVPTMRDLGAAPKPEWGSNAAQPQPRVPKPELRPGGRTPEPQFRVTQPTNNVTPKRNNLSLQRTNLRAPSVPQPPVSRATNLFGRLKNVRGNLATTALNLATAGAIDKYVVKPTGDFLGNQLAKGIISATGQEKLYPNLYGKQGPTLGVDTIKSIRARDAEAAKNAVPGQRTNETGQQSSLPSSGDPSTFPKGNKQPKALSPAAKDFDANFAAARKAGKKEFTWRGKQYHTRLKGE